ncbi:MAG TPA: methionyl-tRNA formyltransferase [Candidatus Dormibacteraeota bacterium]|nr:methionyl-tRNA formyltransferase [Candidatus Dormibacteraeota bacterium]
MKDANMTKVVFFGNEKLTTGAYNPQPLIRNSLQEAGFQIEAVITGQVGDTRHQASLAVLASHGKILPQAVLDQFPLGVINIHPSLLPIYRGPTPIEQAILDGAAETGVSIMKLTAGMDSGPLYAQESIKLTGHEEKAELAVKLQGIGAKLLLEVLPGIASGSTKPKEQDSSTAPSYTKLIQKSDGVIDWRKPAEQLEREIRAYLGWPGSKAELFKKDITITSAEATKVKILPGLVKINDGKLIVGCGKDSLLINRLKPAGKKEMTASEFTRGLRL